MTQTFSSIIEFTRETKSTIIEEMKVKLASEFMAKLNNVNFDDKELQGLKIEERALSRVEELLETILERMEKG